MWRPRPFHRVTVEVIANKAVLALCYCCPASRPNIYLTLWVYHWFCCVRWPTGVVCTERWAWRPQQESPQGMPTPWVHSIKCRERARWVMQCWDSRSALLLRENLGSASEHKLIFLTSNSVLNPASFVICKVSVAKLGAASGVCFFCLYVLFWSFYCWFLGF